VSLWVSSSGDLEFDAAADLRAVRCNARVWNVKSLHLIDERTKAKPLVLFATYNSFVPRSEGALQPETLIEFLGGSDYEGLVSKF
jgi:hypothetical protein